MKSTFIIFNYSINTQHFLIFLKVSYPKNIFYLSKANSNLSTLRKDKFIQTLPEFNNVRIRSLTKLLCF